MFWISTNKEKYVQILTAQMEAELKPKVEQFVNDLNGQYRLFIHDQCLVGLLMLRLRESSHDGTKTARGVLVLRGDQTAAYEAACSIFETILEDVCGVRANGHHKAQAFAQAITPVTG